MTYQPTLGLSSSECRTGFGGSSKLVCSAVRGQQPHKSSGRAEGIALPTRPWNCWSPVTSPVVRTGLLSRHVLGPGHVLGCCPEKQGLKTAPEMLESACGTDRLQHTVRHHLPQTSHGAPPAPRTDTDPAALCQDRDPQLAVFLMVKCLRTGGWKSPKLPWHLCI